MRGIHSPHDLARIQRELVADFSATHLTRTEVGGAEIVSIEETSSGVFRI